MLRINDRVVETYEQRTGVISNITYNDGRPENGIRHVELIFEDGTRQWFYELELNKED